MDRTEAIEKLESGKIKVVFSVDMFNEGVDIPSVDSSCYFPETKHLRPFAWPCNISDDEDGAVFMLGVDKCMDDSKLARHSVENINKIRSKKY